MPPGYRSLFRASRVLEKLLYCMKAAIARKVGMTQIFDQQGNQVPVTLVEVAPNTVVESRVKDSESRVLLGLQTRKQVSKSIQGKLKKAGIDRGLTKFREFTLAGQLKPGQTIGVEQFKPGDALNVTSITKGKGFAGTIKRHGFKRGPASHGSNNVRQPGSIGAQEPQRVLKGKKMAGRMGGIKRTVKRLPVVEVDPEHRLVALKGSVPGPDKAWVYLWQK